MPRSLRQHVLELLIAERDFVDGIAAVLERDVIAVDVGWEEDLWIPGEALARGEVGNQAWWTLGIANVDNGGLFLLDGGAEKTPSTLVKHLILVFRRG